MNKSFLPHIIRYRSLNGLVYVQHLWCSLYDILFSFFNYSQRIHKKIGAQTNTVRFFMMHEKNWEIRRLHRTLVWGVMTGCVISTSEFSILYLFQSLSHHHAVNGRSPGWKKESQNDRTLLFLTFQNTYFKALLIYFVCGVCKSVHVRDRIHVAKWMFNFIFRPHSNVKRIDKKMFRDVYLFVGGGER